MFNLLESVIKTAGCVASIPISVVADVVTLGGALTDKERLYTAEACSDLVQNVQDLTKPLSK